MSMDRCAGCDRMIDTDDDPDCYRDKRDPRKPWENYAEDGVCLCEFCRPEEE